MGRLAEALDAEIRRSTDELIALHGLSGRAAREVLKRMKQDYTESAPARENVATVLGGIISGAAGGLAADLAAGGLTLGGGMLVGSVLGAFGAKSAARGYNMARGEESNAVRWSDDFLLGLTRSALLRYLAVAHFGRGRGEWEEGEHPTHWQAEVERVVEGERAALRSAWARAREGRDAVASALEPVLTRAAEQLLVGLYPEAEEILARRAVASADAEIRPAAGPEHTTA